jgi:hypothetical protein
MQNDFSKIVVTPRRHARVVNRSTTEQISVWLLISRSIHTRFGLTPKERVVSGEEYDETIIVERLATPGRPGRRILRFLWSSFVYGAAMYGAAVHGYPNPEYLQSVIVHEEDNE